MQRTGGMYNPVEYGGTIRNCADGPTPWHSWVSCEETFHLWGSRDDGYKHGYVFDVPAFGTASGRRVRAAGGFSQEAVAVDPRTGILHETEDANPCGFYKYVQPGTSHWRGDRRRGKGPCDGGLYALAIAGESGRDLRGREWTGATFYGDRLFANVQSAGVTFAIRDPWRKGGL
ncbi:alkaline phosphatase PhoX [Microbulbifer halophilus]|uniref:Alkaline phosphatase PhoX n=1 Tax=Microbulbifer halophilus TaxID=453963 RepID=A0ABW5E612_9GAMM|nr:alkaline phosphatase PhoX [Microbulbifer halophilus]MCW8127429.1 DUF839 domain-containing protein [Microbulbifer halophilus]